MLIDIPVFICFNAQGSVPAYTGRSSEVFGRTFTMRFDPENDSVRPQYANEYPPKSDTKFWPDDAGLLFDLLPSSATDKRFLELANADPESYFAATHYTQSGVGR